MRYLITILLIISHILDEKMNNFLNLKKVFYHIEEVWGVGKKLKIPKGICKAVMKGTTNMD